MLLTSFVNLFILFHGSNCMEYLRGVCHFDVASIPFKYHISALM